MRRRRAHCSSQLSYASTRKRMAGKTNAHVGLVNPT